MPYASFVLCPQYTESFNLWQRKPEESKHAQPLDAGLDSEPWRSTFDYHARHYRSFGNRRGGLPEILMFSFPKTSITNYMKWPKSKFLLFYKNLSVTIADLYFSQFSYKKKFSVTTKYQIFIFIKCQDNLLKLRFIIFYCWSILRS